jgi:hypothetical protein
MSFFRFMEKKGYEADLEAASKVTLSATTALKKLAKAQTREKDPAKAKRLTKVEAAKVRLINAKVMESMLACLAYDLFRKLLRDEPQIQWDQIMTDMHTKNPWEDIKGVKHNSLHGKSQRSLMDCIEFHKLTVFTVDATERLRYYLMCSIKKPVRWTIRMHISRMEVLNKYLGILPTIKNSPFAVATMEMGNVPFTEATHASIILSHLPVAWRNQYDLTHKIVLELPRAMLQDLKISRSSSLRSTMRKPKPTRLRLQQPPRPLSKCPRSARMGEGPIEEPPKRAILLSIASGARQQMGPIPPTIPLSVVGLRRMARQRTSLLSPLTPQRSPGKRWVVEIPVRWLILLRKWLSSKRSLKRLRSTVRSMLVTRWIVIPTVTRIVGPVAQDCK